MVINFDAWKVTTIRPGNLDELDRKVHNSRTNQMMTVKTRKGGWIARWKHVRNFVRDLPAVGRSDIPWYHTIYEQWWNKNTVVLVNRIINLLASVASEVDTPMDTFLSIKYCQFFYY